MISSPYSIPRNGLVGEYLLDGNAIDTNNGTKVNGTATNVTYANTSIGYQKQGGVFNGTSSNINLGTGNIGVSGSFTFSCWYTPASKTTASTYQVLFNDWAVNKTNFYIYTSIGNNGVLTALSGNGATLADSTQVTYTLVDGVTYHICYVRNGTTKTLYINNVAVSTYTGGYSGGLTTNSKRIGSESTGIYNLNGKNSTNRIYNRALSSSEIQNLYLEGLGLLGLAGEPQLMSACTMYADFNGDSNDIIGGFASTLANAPTLTTDNFGISRGYTFGNSAGHTKSISYPGNIPNLAGAVTIEMMIKFNTSSATAKAILDWRSTTTTARYMILACNTGANRLTLDASGTVIEYATTLDTTSYHHLAFTYTAAGAVKGYLDGVEIMSGTRGTTTSANTGLFIGNFNNNTNGMAQDVAWCRTHTRAFSADDVKKASDLAKTKYLYPYEKSMPRNLVQKMKLWYAGDNASGSYKDASGNGLDGTMSGTLTNTRRHRHKSMTYTASQNIAFPSIGAIGSSFGIAITVSPAINTNLTVCRNGKSYNTGFNGFDIVIGAGGLDFRSQYLSTSDTVCPRAITNTETRRIMVTYDGATVSWYVDGKLFYSAARTGTISGSGDTNRGFGIADATGTDGPAYQGKMSNMIIYSSTPTALEAQQDFYSTFIK